MVKSLLDALNPGDTKLIAILLHHLPLQDPQPADGGDSTRNLVAEETQQAPQTVAGAILCLKSLSTD